MPTAEEAYQARREDVLAFLRCPECDGDASIEVHVDHEFDGSREVVIRPVCKECDHETEPLPIAASEAALYERVSDALHA